jgi:hypothetical protein
MRKTLAAVLLLAALAPTSARAEDRPALDMRTWRPSTDPNASLVLEPAVTPGTGLSFGAYGSYAFRPVQVGSVRPVAHTLGVDAIVNLGIGSRLAIGAGLPVILYQHGDSSLPATVSQSSKVPTSGVGDLGISAKATLVRNDHGGFGLAALGYVTIPIGDRASFMTESAPTATGRLLAEYSILIATLQGSVGYKVRTARHTWPDASVDGVRFGNELPWTIGLTTRPAAMGIDPGNRQRIEVAFHGWLPAGPVAPFENAKLSPVLLTLSDRIELGHYRDTFMTIGGEIGLNQAYGVPTFRAVLALGWAPKSHDFDGDGVNDDVDVCPGTAEDKDGFEDEDGCPEPDNDLDGILDRDDACPNVKGTSSNGCPAGTP